MIKKKAVALLVAAGTIGAGLTALAPAGEAQAACDRPTYVRYVEGPSTNNTLIYGVPANLGSTAKAGETSSPSASSNIYVSKGVSDIWFPSSRDVAWSVREEGTNAILSSGKYFAGDQWRDVPCGTNAKAVVVRMYPDGVLTP